MDLSEIDKNTLTTEQKLQLCMDTMQTVIDNTSEIATMQLLSDILERVKKMKYLKKFKKVLFAIPLLLMGLICMIISIYAVNIISDIFSFKNQFMTFYFFFKRSTFR